MTRSHEAIATDRREMHACISPAVYSKHAQELLIPDINSLHFPERTLTDSRLIVKNPVVKSALTYSSSTALEIARQNKIEELTEAHGIFHHGYGDRHFVPLAASALTMDIGSFLHNKGLISSPLSLHDQAKF